MPQKHVVAAVDEIPPGARKLVDVDGRAIVVFNLGGEFFAIINRCPHKGGSLCEGRLTGLVQSSEPGEYELFAARRDHPLPVARLGIRYPHRQVVVRSRKGARAQLCGRRGAGANWSRARLWPKRFRCVSRTTTWWWRPRAG